MDPHDRLESFGPQTPKKQFVLCFDGTGNKFAGDVSDTNLVKIYRMLDRSRSHQYHYYQPGIGTYVSSNSLGSKGRVERIKSSYKKAKDAALGSSFDEHVLGGYKFLMRYYAPGDDIYFFGFSRGSYTARFLAEMLDYIGLLQPGNEELIRFAWKTFAKWQQRGDTTEEDHAERRKLFTFMKAFRETFSRPVSRIRFLGLFDTVNSVPMFENAWMERSKFPYTAQTTAKVIRHAVSIDERRAKFRQDLIGEVKPWAQKHAHRLRHLLDHAHHLGQHGHHGHHEKQESKESNVPQIVVDGTQNENENQRQGRAGSRQDNLHEEMRYRVPSRSPARKHEIPTQNGLLTDRTDKASIMSGNSLHVPNETSFEENPDEAANEQDISEVWFPGQHGDVGGGWALDPEDPCPLSHIPLVWMVKEAQLAGLQFDPEKLKRFDCYEEPSYEKLISKPAPAADGANANPETKVCHENHKQDKFHEVLTQTMDKGIVHDCLTYGGGLSTFSTLAWRLMEYLPIRRMDLQPDGSWKPISWPLPCGEVRDIPEDAQIHICAIHRMKMDPRYRPGNLIVGGGGRGVKRAPEEYGIGEWEVYKHEGDPVRQTYVRKRAVKDGKATEDSKAPEDGKTA